MPQPDQHTAQLLEALKERERQFANRNKTPVTQEVQEKTVQYWQTVFSTQPSAIQPIRQFRQEMTFEEAKKKLWLVMVQRGRELEVLKPGFEWVFTQEQRQIINDLLKYFINDPSSAYPLTKGVYLYSVPGTGKTELMQCFSAFTKINGLSKAFEFSVMSKRFDDIKIRKNFDVLPELTTFDRCLDELFLKVGTAAVYGESIDINQHVIEQRYSKFTNYGQLTHAITNMGPGQISSIILPMLHDRLSDMLTFIHYPGASHRGK
jgi:hypothetical protein